MSSRRWTTQTKLSSIFEGFCLTVLYLGVFFLFYLAYLTDLLLIYYGYWFWFNRFSVCAFVGILWSPYVYCAFSLTSVFCLFIFLYSGLEIWEHTPTDKEELPDRYIESTTFVGFMVLLIVSMLFINLI